tara:strand:+ start:1831 stop:2532 length:702 start_codon:yes stop_codon:yes gene_type:complete
MPIMPQAGFAAGAIALVYSSDTADVDGFAAAGSPAGDVVVNITITSGTELYASTTSNYGLDLNGFSAGSLVNLFIEGEIQGKGGKTSGAAGGPALRLGCETNTSGAGAIRGGGGAGGQGGSSKGSATDAELGCIAVGGNVSGGAGGDGQDRVGGPASGSTGGSVYAAKNAGTGGTGGAWGAAGNTGGTGNANTCGAPGYNNAGSAGGAAGLAIKTQSNTYSNLVTTTNGSISA